MRDCIILLVHLVVTLAGLARPSGLRSVVAESVLLRQQLLILNRGRKRAANLRATDRIIAGLCTLFVRPTRLLRAAIALRPSTLLHLHDVLKKRKYRLLFSRPGARRRGPKGPNQELIDAVVATKQRNPRWGYLRIAQQITLAFGVEIDKDVVRRILSAHYRPESDSAGPSWFTCIGHTKGSLWSCDLFRCESAMLKTHWVLVVMDQFTWAWLCGVYTGELQSAAAFPAGLSSAGSPGFRFPKGFSLASVVLAYERPHRDQLPIRDTARRLASRLVGAADIIYKRPLVSRSNSVKQVNATKRVDLCQALFVSKIDSRQSAGGALVKDACAVMHDLAGC